MKKLLSFALVLAMVLGSVSMAFAGTELLKDISTLSDDNQEAINVLTGLDVVGGYGDGTFRPDGSITRAEMVKMVIAALGIPVTQGYTPTQFSDVDPNAWYAAYVNYAVSLGLVSGYGDNTFRPNNNITYDEAIKISMTALGYTQECLTGTYPACFIAKAVGLKALDGSVPTGSVAAKRSDIAQLVYNVLDCEIGKVDADGTWQPYGDGDKMLTRLGAAVKTSTVAGVTSTKYEVVDMDMIQSEDTLVDLSGLFGQVISYYTNDDGEIVAVAEQLTTPITGTYYDKNSDDGDGYFLINGTKFYKNTVTFAGASDEASYVYFDNTAIDTVLTSAPALVNDTSYTLAVTMKDNKVEKVYSAAKWNVTYVGMVDEDDLDCIKEEDPTLLAGKFVLDDNDEIDTKNFLLAGVDSLEDIEEGNVVYVYANSANEIKKIEVGQKVVTGNLDEVTSGGKLVIDGTTYAIPGSAVRGKAAGTNNYNDATEITAKTVTLALETDDECTVYLDYAGKAFAVEAVSSSDYAVFLAFQAYDSTKVIDGSTAKIKVFTEDGEEVDYELANSTATDPAYKKATTLADITAGDILKLTKNSSGKVTGIVSVKTNTTYKTGSNKSINTKGLLDGNVIKSSTVVFVYDKTGATDLEDADNWAVVDYSTVLDSDSVTFYGDSNSNGEYKVVAVNGGTSAQDTYVIFTAWNKVTDYQKVKVLEDGEVATYLSDTTDVIYTTGGALAWKVDTAQNAKLYSLKLDAKGVITAATVFNPQAAKHTYDSGVITTSGNSFKLSGDFFKATVGGTTTNYTVDDDMIVYVYDLSDEAWTVKTASYLGGVKDSTAVSVQLFDTLDDDTDLYNIAIVVTK